MCLGCVPGLELKQLSLKKYKNINHICSKAELERMKGLNVTVKQTETTNRVHSMVTVVKPKINILTKP